MNLSNLSKSHSKETNQAQLWLQAHIYIKLLLYMFVKEQGGGVGEAFKIQLILLVLFFYMEYNSSVWGISRK